MCPCYHSTREHVHIVQILMSAVKIAIDDDDAAAAAFDAWYLSKT